ncbi:MAG: anaerobic sulfatase-maturation protein [Candidatus Eremiobacteraeota bacterium]|nr:anaerobic sulfatase-maturation protein [Candidatus Eremiobacteraeota bacterium]
MNEVAFHIMTKPTGPICNLDCKYCFYLEKERLYPGKHSWKMPPETLESYIRQHIETQTINEVTFAWQGGEPTLMGLDYFRQVVELQRRYGANRRIVNAFQTNGVLLDDDWCRFFQENQFLIGISIDGPEPLHDYYRVDRGGKPSFQKVMRGLEFLHKHQVDFNTLTVVNDQNSRHPLEVYRFLKSIGSLVMQFIPVVERLAEGPSADGLDLVSPEHGEKAHVTDWSVDSDRYGSFLCAIFDEWVKQDVGRRFVQLFDITLESYMGMPQSLCWFRERCGEALALEHNGDLYSCDHFVYPAHRLGNIMEEPLLSLVQSQQQKDFGNAKADSLPKQCLQCDVRFACHGECPKHRFLETADGEPGLNYLCSGYLRFFRHTAPYMKFMANQLRLKRSPSEVMGLAARLEPEFAKAARNEACPCGSEQKFKKCCGRTR